MRFSLASSTALFGLALSMSSTQATPFNSDMIIRGTAPSTSPVCTNFKAACTTQCGTRQPFSKCIEFGKDKLPLLNCRCGNGWLSDKTAEVLFRMALTCAAKPGAGTPTKVEDGTTPGQVDNTPKPPPKVDDTPTPVIKPAFSNPGFEDVEAGSWLNAGYTPCFLHIEGGHDSLTGHRAVCPYSDDDSSKGVKQELTNLVPEKKYTITFWARRAGYGQGASMKYGVQGDVRDGGDTPSEWTEYTYALTPQTSSVTFSAFANAYAGMEFDDFAINEAPASKASL